MVRVGIIGCGRIAQMRHIPEYRDNPWATVKAVYDADPKRAEEVAKECGARVCKSCEELLESPDIDGVSILTPNCTHAKISVAALKAGKHVLCEKPMAVTYADCMEMDKTAQEEGRILMIAHNQRLAPAHVKARQLLAQGVIGQPLVFSTAFTHGGPETWSVDGRKSWFMDKERSRFGAMADLGIHKLDLMCYLLDSPIAKVSALTGTLDKTDDQGKRIAVDDNAFCTLIMENGVMGTLRAGWTNYGREENYVSVFGTKGVLHIYRRPEAAVEVERADGTREVLETGAIQTNENQTASGVIDLFIEAVEKKRPSPISAQMVLPAMKAVFACAESAQREGAMVCCSSRFV